MGAINYSWIQSELQGLYGANVIREMEDIIGIYEWYDGTAQIWDVASGLDYRPTRMRTNLIKKLINEEARFMLSRAPEIRLKPENAGDQQAADECEKWLNDIMDRTRFNSKLIRAGRDCFIGKRVAIKLTGGRDAEINITFHPSLEFVFDVDAADAGKITKIIFFYQVTSDETDRAKQRIWRQKFEMKGKRCILNEALYDGYGALVEQYHADADTGLNFIPAYVIINSGLTGDVSGESDARELIDNQDAYNRLKSDNADAMKFNMFPMRVFLDASQDSMEGLTIAPNAAIDLSTDPASEGGRADAKMMESAFQYGEQLENTLNRIKSDMHDIVGVPEVTPEQLKGTAMSGKAIMIPNEQKATIPSGKMDYMLRLDVNKAKLFKSALGYEDGDQDALKAEILEKVKNGEYVCKHTQTNEYGEIFSMHTFLNGKNGRAADTRLGWILKKDDTLSLTTAFPEERGQKWK